MTERVFQNSLRHMCRTNLQRSGQLAYPHNYMIGETVLSLEMLRYTRAIHELRQRELRRTGNAPTREEALRQILLIEAAGDPDDLVRPIIPVLNSPVGTVRFSPDPALEGLQRNVLDIIRDYMPHNLFPHDYQNLLERLAAVLWIGLRGDRSDVGHWPVVLEEDKIRSCREHERKTNRNYERMARNHMRKALKYVTNRLDKQLKREVSDYVSRNQDLTLWNLLHNL